MAQAVVRAVEQLVFIKPHQREVLLHRVKVLLAVVLLHLQTHQAQEPVRAVVVLRKREIPKMQTLAAQAEMAQLLA